MATKLHIMALATALSTTAGLTFATSLVSNNPERDLSHQEAPTARSRADVQKELAEYRLNPVSSDAWQEIGGERGWVRLPHRYDLQGGQIVHTDPFDHDAPKAATRLSREERSRSDTLYGNAP